MKTYKIVITDIAKSQLRNYIAYIFDVLKNKQAAIALKEDALLTQKELEIVADSISPIKQGAFEGYRKIHLKKHRYVLLYSIHDDIVYVERIYHELQDYENYLR